MHWIKDLSRKALALLLFVSTFCWMGQQGFAAQSAHAATLPPQPPHTLYGIVTIDGTPASDGTQLDILITHSATETVSASTATFSSGGQSGYYSIVLAADDGDTLAYDGGQDGDSITFSVAGNSATESASFSSGSNQSLNLTISNPTATPTDTPIPPTATPTDTPVPPTATPTDTPIPPTATPTNTPIPPTATPTKSPIPPTATPTKSPIPPTATPTNTPVPPTATPTKSPIPPTATPTKSPIPPTATPTNSPVPQRDCTQAALGAAFAAPVNGTVTLDGSCRYLLTAATYGAGGSDASGFYIPNVTVVEGNGATIERQSTGPQFRLLLLKTSSTLRNLTLRGGNSLSSGGGFYSQGNVILENVRLENNVAAGSGGGGGAFGSTTVRNSLISNNRAKLTGGGFWSYRNVTLENVRLENNVAGYGGGGGYAFGSTTVRNSLISNNQAGFDGGGLLIYGSNTSLLLSSSRLLGNRASGNGGGILYYGPNLQISNSLFARNKSGRVNGGAQLHTALSGSLLTLVNSTFSDSSQNSNPAIFVSGAMRMTNTIITNHQIGLGTAGGSAYTVSEDYNLFAGNGSDVRVIYDNSTIIRGTHSVVVLEPRFADAASDNYRLAANSPAIDAGTSGGPANDADGQPRPANGVADIGAYEFQAQPAVTLQIVKEAPAWIVSNQPGRYALTVLNASKLTAENVQIVETLPTGATYINGSADSGGVFTSGMLSWSVGSLPPGGSKRVEYQASASQTLVSANYRAISSNIIEVGKPITTALNSRIIAALDFQPNPDGFAFPNYSDSPDSDLNVDDMVFIFGSDKVCKSQNPCVLTAAAEAWRQSWLALVQGGHCAGMAMGSLEIFANDLLAPPSFQAGANVTYDLSKSNARRFVALYATTQTQVPVNYASLQSQGWSWVPANTPVGVLNVLLSNFQNPAATDRYRLGFYRPQAAGGGAGHTVVPYAIEQLNNDEFLIYIYENNAPNDFTRAIRINRTANSWSYVGTTAPDQPLFDYYGTAADANINLVSWRWATSFPKRCNEFCTPSVASGVQSAGQDLIDGELMEFQMDGEGYLLVTRNDGKRVGFDPISGSWISEIDGAERTEVNTGLGLNLPPILRIPHSAGATYRVQVSNRDTASGNLIATANVNIFGSNFAVRLIGLQINSPELTPVDLDGGPVATSVQESAYDEVNVTFNPTDKRLTYQASSNDGDTPAVSMAVNNPNGSDYQFTVDSLQLGSNQSLAVAFDSSNGQLSVENNNGDNGSYSVAVERINQDGTTDSFVNDQVSDGNGVGVILQVGDSWDGVTPPAVEENTTPTLPGLLQIFLPLVSR